MRMTIASRATDGLSSTRVAGSCSGLPRRSSNGRTRYEWIVERLSKVFAVTDIVLWRKRGVEHVLEKLAVVRDVRERKMGGWGGGGGGCRDYIRGGGIVTGVREY